VFDEHNKGLVFASVHLPIKKLGLIYCLNRPTEIVYVKDPVFDKKKVAEAAGSDYIKRVNPASEYLGMQPRFSRDFSRLAYVGRDQSFKTHSGNY